MSIIFSLVFLVAIPVLAYRGKGYRMLYLAAAVVAGAAGFLAVVLTPTRLELARSLASGNAADARGAQFMSDNFSGIALWLFAAAFGAFIGMIIFRAAPATAPKSQAESK